MAGPTTCVVIRGGGGRGQTGYLPGKNPHTSRGVHDRLQRAFYFRVSEMLVPSEMRKMVEAMLDACDMFTKQRVGDALLYFWQTSMTSYDELVKCLLDMTGIPDRLRRELLEKYINFLMNFGLKNPNGNKPNAVSLVKTLQYTLRAWCDRIDMASTKFLDNHKGSPEAQPQKAELLAKMDEFVGALNGALETFADSIGVELRPLPERRCPTSNPLRSEDFPALGGASKTNKE